MTTSDAIASALAEKADATKRDRTRLALEDLEERLAVVTALDFVVNALEARPPEGVMMLLGAAERRLAKARRQLQEVPDAEA